MSSDKQQVMYLVKGNQLLEAQTLCSTICRASPEDAEAWFLLGAIHGQLGEFAEAEACCRKSLQLAPRRAPTHYNLADVLVAQGKLEGAITHYREALKLQPWLPQASYQLGSALLLKGDAVEAIERLEDAIAVSPDFAEAHFALGNALHEAGRYENAAVHFRRTFELKPGYPAAYYNHALALLACNRPDDCLLSLDKAIHLQPDYLDAHLQLGSVLQSLGRDEEAIACYRQALEIDSANPKARHSLAALGAEPAPDRMPGDYVVQYFDGFADSFEIKLIQHLGYKAPQSIYEAVERVIPDGARLDILDLGCGTGLCGALFRSVARHLTGVDLSSKMMDKARQRNIYDRLVLGELLQPLQEKPNAYDLVVAGDVFIYIGDLVQTFQACASSLKCGGLLAFSIESAEQDETYALRSSGRYAHSVPYIRDLCKTSGLEEISIHNVILRQEKNQPVNGNIVVLRKPIAGG